MVPQTRIHSKDRTHANMSGLRVGGPGPTSRGRFTAPGRSDWSGARAQRRIGGNPSLDKY